MYSAYSSMRRILINDYYISTAVTADNVKIGYRREIDVFPCITIFRIGGSSIAKLGYNATTGGSREREETRMMQVDILHADSIADLELLDDKVITAIMSGARTQDGFRLLSDLSRYDDSYEAFRTTQTWLYSEIVSD